MSEPSTETPITRMVRRANGDLLIDYADGTRLRRRPDGAEEWIIAPPDREKGDATE